jgi:osmotically-inducible protein OsmY
MNKAETSSNSSQLQQPQVANILSDQDTVVDRIQRTLACLGYAQLNNIRCVANGDEITLNGQLDSYYLKQVAQSVAIKIPGVRNVRNDIQVT